MDGQDNVTISGNSTVTGLQNGLNSIRIYANDIYGDMAWSETASFTVAVPEPFPSILVVAVSGVSITVIAAGLLVYFKKRRR